MSKYGGDCARGIAINDDGTWLCVGVRASDEKLVFEETGNWHMDGVNIILKSDQGSKIIYKYCVTGKLTNDDVEYEYISK